MSPTTVIIIQKMFKNGNNTRLSKNQSLAFIPNIFSSAVEVVYPLIVIDESPFDEIEIPEFPFPLVIVTPLDVAVAEPPSAP